VLIALVLTITLICGSIRAKPLLDFATGLLFIAMAPAFVQTIATAEALPLSVALVILGAILISRLRRRRDRGLGSSALQPPPNITDRFLRVTDCWIAQIDVERRSLTFPHDTAMALGLNAITRFDEILAASDSSGLIDLLAVIESSRLKSGDRGESSAAPPV